MAVSQQQDVLKNKRIYEYWFSMANMQLEIEGWTDALIEVYKD